MWAKTYPSKAKEGDTSWILNEAQRALGRLCWQRRAGRILDQDALWVSSISGAC